MQVDQAIDLDFDVLPVIEFKNEILDIMNKHQVIICIGETGSGKTTQIPQFFIDENFSRGRQIAVTQPRRIAAITVAQRVSDERKTKLGEDIGYSVRFDDCSGPNTKVKFMTDGILVRECLFDKNLSKYSVIMLDEAHERSLHTDILFGLMKQVCINRPDLKLIITSATLDCEKFSVYFDSCPIVRVPGRIYPVDVYHSKLKQIMTTSGPANNSYVQSAVDTVLKIHKKDEEGHILLFLTGQEEIELACKLIRDAIKNRDNSDDNDNSFDDKLLLVLPLYAALPADVQARVFKKPSILVREMFGRNNNNSNHNQTSTQPKIIRKCVVATNIAETSITVPHVRFVIDTGYVKQKAYDPTRGMESLIVVPISKVSALQRSGRAGRTGPGQCYRLYSSECYDKMMDETIPEIQRINLANTILYLKVLNIHDVLGFEFMDPPSEEQILQALIQLHTLGAIDNKGYITPLGKDMSQFPLEPCLSRCIIESAKEDCNCLDEMVTVAAMLSIENIWYQPNNNSNNAKAQNRNNKNRDYIANAKESASRLQFHNKQTQQMINYNNEYNTHEMREQMHQKELENKIELIHNSLRSIYGDHLTLLNIYQQWEKHNYSIEWCEEHYIQHRSMKTARKTRDQLMQEVDKLKLIRKHNIQDKKSLERRVCDALATGYFMNAAQQSVHETIYKLMPLQTLNHSNSNNVMIVHIHPSSVFSHSKPPEYVVYQDLVYSSKIFMKQIVKVSKNTLMSLLEHYQYLSPYILSGREPPVAIKPVVSNANNVNSNSNNNDAEKDKKATNIFYKDAVVGQKRPIKSILESTASNDNANNGITNNNNALSAIELAKQRYLERKQTK